MQFLRSYCVHKARWPWASLKVQKCHTKDNIKLFRYVNVKNTPIKLQHHTSNTWEVITFTRQFDREQVWKFKNVTQRSTLNLSKILMWRILLHVSSKQNDEANLWRVIMFTRSFQKLPAWKFKKVTQRSTLNLTEILMSRTSVPVQLQHDAGKF